MEPSKSCPMCGATIAADAKRCRSCGESFAPPIRKQTLLRANITPAGILPGAIAGVIAAALIGLILLIAEWNNSIEFASVVPGVLLCLTIGAAAGSAVAVFIRLTRSSRPDAD